MTERGADQLSRNRSQLAIGPSEMHWTGDALQINIDEVCAPVPRHVRGTIRLIPSAWCDRSFSLPGSGLHRWTPFAPCARVEVALTQPALNWCGVGYFDSNSGAEPLENAFARWSWSRASLPDSTVVLYDVAARGMLAQSLALRFAPNGTMEDIELPPPVTLPRTRWQICRETRADPKGSARVAKTLEDGPFYSRTQLDTCLLGVRAPAIHESLDLDRFGSRWVQCLLPFRMPRIASIGSSR